MVRGARSVTTIGAKCRREFPETQPSNLLPMIATLYFAAVGYSLVYLLFGGGFGGAVLIFIIAKLLGK